MLASNLTCIVVAYEFLRCELRKDWALYWEQFFKKPFRGLSFLNVWPRPFFSCCPESKLFSLLPVVHQARNRRNNFSKDINEIVRKDGHISLVLLYLVANICVIDYLR